MWNSEIAPANFLHHIGVHVQASSAMNSHKMDGLFNNLQSILRVNHVKINS